MMGNHKFFILIILKLKYGKKINYKIEGYMVLVPKHIQGSY